MNENFLDFTLMKLDNQIRTIWNTKEFQSKKYLNFQPVHIISQSVLS